MNTFLQRVFTLAALLCLAACGGKPTQASTVSLPTDTARPAASTPGQASACTSPAAPTVSMTEGPYFKASSPERASLLEPGMKGTKLLLSGYVLTTECKPVAHALVDFWQANADGQYDNVGFTLRGHQYTDATGHYQLATVIPGLYPGRTEHIHVKVQAPGGSILTTQLFFPGVSENESDGIFDSSLLIAMQDGSDGKLGSYNFVVNAP